jgi:hypothetical protein
MKDSIKPVVSAGRTRVSVDTNPYSYDEAGLSFDSNISYGGVYGEDITPIIAFSVSSKPKSLFTSIYPNLTVGRTEKQINTQQYTYDESGIAFDANIEYGGVYGYDFAPMISSAQSIYPSILFGMDFSGTATGHGTIILQQGMLIGILGNTYSQSGTIIF